MFETQNPNKGENEHGSLEILEPGDAAVLYESGLNVAKKIMEDFPDKLPDIIIFPDTAARPLMYLFEPVFSEIAEKRNVPKPKYVFFQHFGEAEEDKEIYEIETTRMKKISSSGETAIVIDETALDTANTLTFLNDLYSKIAGKELGLYTLTSMDLTNKRVFSGTSAYMDVFDDTKSTDLHYRRSKDHTSFPGGIRQAFGVEKSRDTKQLYVQLLAERNREEEASLRFDMKTIGNMIAIELAESQ